MRDFKQGRSLDHYLEDKSILRKRFGRGIEGRRIADARGASWTSRQQDLYNGERRFIFAVEDGLTGLKWISKINQAVSAYNVTIRDSPPRQDQRESIQSVYQGIEDSILGQSRSQPHPLALQGRVSELSEDFDLENLGDSAFDQEITLPKRISQLQVQTTLTLEETRNRHSRWEESHPVQVVPFEKACEVDLGQDQHVRVMSFQDDDER